MHILDFDERQAIGMIMTSFNSNWYLQKILIKSARPINVIFVKDQFNYL